MVLHDVTDCPRLFVELPTTGHTKFLSHGDLYALDVVAVPDRFEKRVSEAEEEHILDWLFATNHRAIAYEASKIECVVRFGPELSVGSNLRPSGYRSGLGDRTGNGTAILLDWRQLGSEFRTNGQRAGVLLII